MSAPVEETRRFSLPEADRERFASILERYPTRRSAMMPALWMIQDRLGHVPPEAAEWLAGELGVSPAKVREVLSFYTMFRERPQAKHVLQVCRNISCHVMGAREIIAHLEKRLGVRLGEATPDGMFALEGVECLGACGIPRNDLTDYYDFNIGFKRGNPVKTIFG